MAPVKTRPASKPRPATAAIVRATAVTGSHQAAAPMAMRPDMTNRAVARKRETSSGPAPPAWNSCSYGE